MQSGHVQSLWICCFAGALCWYTHEGYKLPAMFKTRQKARGFRAFYYPKGAPRCDIRKAKLVHLTGEWS